MSYQAGPHPPSGASQGLSSLTVFGRPDPAPLLHTVTLSAEVLPLRVDLTFAPGVQAAPQHQHAVTVRRGTALMGWGWLRPATR
jgi:hypothetical protein